MMQKVIEPQVPIVIVLSLISPIGTDGLTKVLASYVLRFIVVLLELLVNANASPDRWIH